MGWTRKLQKVAQRDANICQLGLHPTRKADRTLDHIIPKSHGGTDSMNNLRLACRQCNEARGASDCPRCREAPGLCTTSKAGTDDAIRAALLEGIVL